MAGLSIDSAEDILHTRFAPWVLDLDLSVVATGETTVSIKMTCNQSHLIHGTIVSGQALMALADTTMVIAICCARGRFIPCATVDLTTSFMRPASDDTIMAHAEIVRLGKSMGFANCRMTSGDDDKLVATAVGTYALPSR